MRGIVLSIGLLACSSYIWPVLYKRSGSETTFLIVSIIGLAVAATLAWLSPKIERSSGLKISGWRIVFLILCSAPGRGVGDCLCYCILDAD